MDGYPFLETMVRQTQNDPEAIAADNRLQARFFWNVKNVQITHFKDSHNEFVDYGDTIEVKTITETTQYATITYERNMGIPHYMEVKELEERYRETTQEVKELREDLRDLSSKAIDRENLVSAQTVILILKYGILLLIAYVFYSLPQKISYIPKSICCLYALAVIVIGAIHLLRKQKEFAKTKKRLESDAQPRLAQLERQIDELHFRVAREL